MVPTIWHLQFAWKVKVKTGLKKTKETSRFAFNHSNFNLKYVNRVPIFNTEANEDENHSFSSYENEIEEGLWALRHSSMVAPSACGGDLRFLN